MTAIALIMRAHERCRTGIQAIGSRMTGRDSARTTIEKWGLAEMYSNIVGRHDYCAELLSALANERRLLIMCHLLNGEASVGDIARKINLSQSALSQHLARLRAMDLVQTRREGQTIYYSSNCPKARRVLEVLNQVLGTA